MTATPPSETPPGETRRADQLRVDPADVYSLARWFSSRPFNRDGSDKTNVLKSLHAMTQFVRAARTAKRVDVDD